MTNIAELLKDCPKGTKLYSPLIGEVEFAEVMNTDYMSIRVIKRGYGLRFDKYGRYMGSEYPDAECLLFPSKDCRTWEEWKLPVKPKFNVGDWVVFNDNHNSIYLISEIRDFHYTLTHTHGGSMPLSFLQEKFIRPWTISDAKDGDVLATDNGWTCIFQAFDGCGFSSYCFMDSQRWFCESGSEVHTPDSRINGKIHPATKEQRDLLFAKMREAGYQWDADKKELRKINPHYNISNFHVGMPVLVRETSLDAWQYVLFSHCYVGGDGLTRFNAGLVGFNQCIPFNEETKHLLGTTNPCDEKFINW